MPSLFRGGRRERSERRVGSSAGTLPAGEGADTQRGTAGDVALALQGSAGETPVAPGRRE